MNDISTERQHNYVALKWVNDEIINTLKQARQSLECFVENPNGQDLDYCLFFVHQIRSILNIIELPEASNLAAEMEQLIDAIRNDKVAHSNLNEASEVLMQAIIHLPLYLEKVQEKRSENPLILLTLLNDLRTARGEEILVQTSQLLTDDLPNIPPIVENALSAIDSPQLTSHLRKLRQMLQLALANVVRGVQTNTNLEHLNKVFSRLEQICNKAPLGRLWEIVGALVSGLRNGEITNSASVRTLLRQADQELKILLETGINGVNKRPPDDLIKNLLFYISSAPGRSQQIITIKQKYNLSNIYDAENNISPETNQNILDKNTLNTVAVPLTEEITKIKDKLDLFVRGDRRSIDEITSIIPQLNQIADTLVILNAEEPRNLILNQINLLNEITDDSRKIDDTLLLNIASTLLQIENKIDVLLEKDSKESDIPTSDINVVNTVVIHEACLDIERIKEIIVEYINSDWEQEVLTKLPDIMDNVHGVMTMMAMSRASDLFLKCRDYIVNDLIKNNRHPDWEELDHLADAISGIEYYLEGLNTDHCNNDENSLDTAETSLNLLIKKPITINQGADYQEVLSESNKSQELNTNINAVKEEIIDDSISSNSSDSNLDEPVYSLDEFTHEIRTISDSETTNITHEIEELPTLEEPVEEVVTSTSAVQKIIDNHDDIYPDIPQLLPPPSDEEPVDEELREIFIEEAEEVLETINEYLPTWVANPDDKNSLTEIRRAFHTLKGSGRMVRSLVLGELAWSIENLLNRVLDKTITVNQELLELVQQVVSLAPELCNEFAQMQQRRRSDVDLLAATAHAMSKGEPIPTATAKKEQKPTEEQVNAPSATQDLIATDNLEDFEFTEFDTQELDQPSNIPSKENKEVDQKLLEIFKSEAKSYLDSIQTFYETSKNNLPQEVTDELHRALHTLKGSASMANIKPVLSLIKPLEKLAKFCKSHNIKWGQDDIEVLAAILNQLYLVLEQITTGDEPLSSEAEQIVVIAKNIYAKHEANTKQQNQINRNEIINSEAIKLFLIDGMDLLSNIENILKSPLDDNQIKRLLILLSSFRNKAYTAGQVAIVQICELLDVLYTTIIKQSITVDFSLLSKLLSAQDVLFNMMDQIAAHWHSSANPSYVATLKQLIDEISAKPEESLIKQINTAPMGTDDFKQNYQSKNTELPLNLDWETINLYIDDALDSLDNTSAELEMWLSEPDNLASIAVIMGEMRVLKSGARMAKLNNILPLVQEVEGLYRGIRTKKYQQSEILASLLLRCNDALITQIEALQHKHILEADANLMQDIAAFKAGNNPPPTNPNGRTTDSGLTSNPTNEGNNSGFSFELDDNLNLNAAESEKLFDELEQPFPELPNISDELQSVAQTENNYTAEENNTVISEESDFITSDEFNFDDDFATDFVEMFIQDGKQIIKQVNDHLNKWQQDLSNLQPLTAASFALQDLKNDAELAELNDLAALVDKLSSFYSDCSKGKLFCRPALFELLQEANQLIISYLNATLAKTPLPEFNTMAKRLDEMWQQANMPDSGGVANISNSSEPVLIDIPTAADSAAVVHYDSELLPVFLEEAIDVLENANNALSRWINHPENIIELASLQRDLHTVKGGARMAEVSEIANLAHELEFLYEALNEGKIKANEQLFDLLHSCHDQLAAMLEQLQETRSVSTPEAFIKALKDFRANPNAYQAVPLSATISDAKSNDIPQIDVDLIEIFFDEATSLLEEFENTLTKWDKDSNNTTSINDIMRILHTLKGSARLSKFNAIGDLSHNIEQQINNAQANKKDLKSLNETIQTGYLQLCKLLEDAKKQESNLKDTTSKQNPSNKIADNKKAPAQEMIKIAVEQIDNLVNLAGETSIYRGRIEQQVSDFSINLTEMESTIERVRDQLRRLDIETQAQILSTHKEEQPEYADDFDPLELDRHSHLQQLSRSLFESASDLLDLTNTLHSRSRDTQMLLQQQAHINTELQEALMHTRMIPFASIAPRLNRIVRQLSRELNKKVELNIINADNRMDRSVLERVIAPLEHMLRNAIDHGIEDAAQRKKLGKPEVGQIKLELNREGGDIVLNLMDDGAGINVNAVRNKAIERGLMHANDDLTDREIMQFVLKAGFSTAQKVTQISGRGVGMDVAISEVKQIGGAIDIDSTFGKGTNFIIRLPFTLSVNQALMVYAGEDLYAIPLNTIEGIVRIAPNDLKKYYESNTARFDYAGQDYDLIYFGDLLHNNQHPKLIDNSPLPVILVRARDIAVAIQVDSLAGSQEIIVKSLGPQFIELPGVSGATLLGDGRVVIILDLLGMARSVRTSSRTKRDITSQAHSAAQDAHQIHVMVVDDSVTVRKVTTRLLERRGLQVSTAKDGVDAIAQLQDIRPDIMLLDIEMPRMDGFEVATTVRHDERIADLPIIMITSRTGDKHRERALSIGVNSYLGKPYQEDQLIAAIEELIGTRI